MKRLNARIGFVSTRLAGIDGVSLEVEKWVNVLESMGYTCFFFAGESTWPAERSFVVPEAHFTDPAVIQITHDLFDKRTRALEISKYVDSIKHRLKQSLYDFQTRFDLDILVAEDVRAIPTLGS